MLIKNIPILIFTFFALNISGQDEAFMFTQKKTVVESQGYDKVLDFMSSNDVVLPSATTQAIYRKVVDSLIARGHYDSLANFPSGGLWIFAGDKTSTIAQLGINLVNPTEHRFEEVNTTILAPYAGWTSGGTGYLENGYTFARADTAHFYNDYSMGALYFNKSTSGTGLTYGYQAKIGANAKQEISIGQQLIIGQNRGVSWVGEVGALGRLASTNPNASPFMWYSYVKNKVSKGSFNSGGAVPQTINISSETEAYPGSFALGARKVHTFASSVSETPTSITIDSYLADTLSAFFVGPASLSLKNSIYELVSAALGEIQALNDTIDLFAQEKFYLNTTLANVALPALPRNFDGYGYRATGGSGRGSNLTPKLYTVTNNHFEGVGSYNAAIDSANNDGVPSTIVVFAGGTSDTSFFESSRITEGDLTIFGQFVPTGSPALRIHSRETDIVADNVIIQNMTYSAGTDTLPGIARNAIINTAGWTQYGERDVMKIGANYVTIDHCTFNYGTDELMQTRSSNTSISNCLFADPLAYHEVVNGVLVGHQKGKHPKGLLNFKQGVGEGDSLLIYRNAFVGCVDRMPQWGGQCSGLIIENYGFGGQWGIATVYETPREDDTLEGGYPIATIKNNFLDLMTISYMRPYPRGFENAGLLYYDSNYVNGVLTDFEAQEPTHIALNPTHTLPGLQTLPAYLARKYITTFAGANSFYPSAAVIAQKQKAINNTVLPPPNNMGEVGGALYQPDTVNIRTLPANPFSIGASGYTLLEEMADSLHWINTYGPNVTYPGITP